MTKKLFIWAKVLQSVHMKKMFLCQQGDLCLSLSASQHVKAFPRCFLGQVRWFPRFLGQVSQSVYEERLSHPLGSPYLANKVTPV